MDYYVPLQVENMNKHLHTERKIGFDRIRNQVKKACISPLGEKKADAMCFSSDFSFLQHELAVVQEFKTFRTLDGGLPREDFFDLQPELLRLKTEGSYIGLVPLFQLRLSLQTIRSCMQLFSQKSEKYPLLASMVSSIPFPKEIFLAAKQLTDEKGQIPDFASPQLQDIRSQMKRKQAEIDKQILKSLSNAKREGWSNNEAEITFRNGRYVIPLLSSHKRKIKGLVHDESATGLTSYVEPAEVVELSNDLRSLEMEEQREIVKLLTEFTCSLRPYINDLLLCYDFLGVIDFLQAKIQLADALHADIPSLVNYPHMDWSNALHPLLYLKLKEQHREVIPLNIRLDKNRRILIISGPNAGGKSVCMQTVGLLQYMMQCGLPVPMNPSSEMGIFNEIFIDMGDEQSLDDDLSTYSSHLKNMKLILSEASPHSLFLIDEFGAGTDPHIGGAIATAMLEKLNTKKTFGVVTTHYAMLKVLADKHQGIVNGAMLFDYEKLKPRYVLQIGTAGSSFAFEIARSIGLSEEILQRASELGVQKQLDFETQLALLKKEKEALEEKNASLALAEDLLDKLVKEYQEKNAQQEQQKQIWIRTAKAEAYDIVKQANKEIEHTIAAIKEAQAERNATRKARAELQQFQESLSDSEDFTRQNLFSSNNEQESEDIIHDKRKKKTKQKNTIFPPADRHFILEHTPLKIGDMVRIGGGEHVGEISQMQKNKAEIICNGLRISLPISQLEKINKQHYLNHGKDKFFHSEKRNTVVFEELNEKRTNFSPQIDLRGMRADEAVSALQNLYDNAILLGCQELYILHGKGYGVLKNIVRDFFSSQPEVSSLQGGNPDKEGEGVTIIHLR